MGCCLRTIGTLGSGDGGFRTRTLGTLGAGAATGAGLGATGGGGAATTTGTLENMSQGHVGLYSIDRRP